MHAHPATKTILLVEDDLDDQEFITQAFLHIDKHLCIHTVSNGNKVLPYLQNLADSQLPQLIVLDYSLPERDGGEVLQALAQNERYDAIPKIVWSTSDSPQSYGRCIELGAASYLAKPYDIAGIENMARHMLEFCQATV